jgi:hypothetical protein
VPENVTRAMPYTRVQVPAALNEAYMALTVRIDDLNDRMVLFDTSRATAVAVMFAGIVFNMWVDAHLRDGPRHRN